jgi:hypothetical protein
MLMDWTRFTAPSCREVDDEEHGMAFEHDVNYSLGGFNSMNSKF